MLYAYYQQTPLPQALGRTDEILPVFVINTLPSGVAGFIVAAIVAAALSPSLNAMAATTINDFYTALHQPRRRRSDADARIEAGRLWRGVSCSCCGARRRS